MSDDAAIEHFFQCSDEQCLDFIQLCFESQTMGGCGSDALTLSSEINGIFEEVGIGFELTTPRFVPTEEKVVQKLTPQDIMRPRPGRVETARIVKKGERGVRKVAIEPALEILRDPRLTVANEELLVAFEKMRSADYADAITSCGAAFESVLKTIWEAKGWEYDPERDTCAKLIRVCQDNGLLYPFYSPCLLYTSPSPRDS